MAYSGRTHFRTTRGQLSFFAVLSAITLAISVSTSVYPSEWWVESGCWLLFVLSLVAIGDLTSSFVTLEESRLIMRSNFRKRTIPRADIESVAAAKGCPLLLILKDGSKLEVPDLGAQGIDNSVRAWIKAT